MNYMRMKKMSASTFNRNAQKQIFESQGKISIEKVSERDDNNDHKIKAKSNLGHCVSGT